MSATAPIRTLNDMVASLDAQAMRNFCETNGFTVEKLERMLAEVRRRKYLRILAKQKKITSRSRERVVRKIDGDDLVVDAMWDAESYHFWGIKLGYDCWKDKAFKREYLRDNPESAVKLIRPTTIQAGIILQ